MIPDDEFSYLAKPSENDLSFKKINMLYKHTNACLVCDVHPRLHVIRNDIEKVKIKLTNPLILRNVHCAQAVLQINFNYTFYISKS